MTGTTPRRHPRHDDRFASWKEEVDHHATRFGIVVCVAIIVIEITVQMVPTLDIPMQVAR
jgi:hypothetical protein